MRKAVQQKNKIKYRNKQQLPNNDKFLRTGKTNSEYSSSYYVKVGNCKRSDIK